MRTAVALGSNLGDRLENLQAARRQILELDEVQPPILSSGIYETEPVDCERDASKFLNAVVEFDYDGDPGQLLEQVARIEESLGRKRDHQKNVSRTDRHRPPVLRRSPDRQRTTAIAAPADALEKVCPPATDRHPAGSDFA